MGFERILLRPPSFWSERQVALRLSTRAVSVNADAHEVGLEGGAKVRYGQLVWAAGGSARKLTCIGGRLPGVHTIRTRSDTDKILYDLDQASRIVVIGGGYVGLEAAAVLSKLGKQVILLEALDRVLSRVAGEPLSRFYESEHRAHGVDVRLGANIDCLEGHQRVTGVRLADGELIECDMAIAGIGITPNVEQLAAAGASVSDGVHVDEYCRTTLADVFAIGDCALHRNRFNQSRWIRLESVQNANDQAQAVARSIMGSAQAYDVVPWFWSEQYDLKLKTVGLSAGSDDLVLRGDPRGRKFSVVYLRQGRVIALDCVNDTKDYAHGKALVQAGLEISKQRLSNTDVSLRDLLN
jgi:3-phenylpropionate/trans-cinnamate dioxygenase ferredoxin reductase subunit